MEVETSELSPPLDVDNDSLLESSFDLDTSRLRSTVVWIVGCLREQQKRLQLHDRALITLSNGSVKDSAELAGNEASTGRNKSVTKGLENSMNMELINMQISQLQLELNTAPKVADLNRQQESILAEVDSLSAKLNNQMEDRYDALHKQLATATEQIHESVQRIGEDVLQRMDALEERATLAVERASEAAENASKAAEHGNQVSAEPLEGAVQDKYDTSGDWMERFNVLEQTVQRLCSAAPTPAAENRGDSESQQMHGEPSQTEGPPEPNERQASGAVAETANKPGGVEAPSTLEKSPSRAAAKAAVTPARDPAGTVPGPGVSGPSGNDPSAQLGARDRGNSADSLHLHNAVVTDPSIFDFVSQISDLREILEKHRLELQRMKGTCDYACDNVERLNKPFREMTERFDNLEHDVDEVRHGMDHLVENIANMGDGNNAAVEAMRKEWAGKAANRGPKSDTEGGSRPRSRAKDSQTPSPSSNSLGRMRPASSPSPRSGASDAAGAGGNLQVLEDMMHDLEEKYDPRLSYLEDATKHLRHILLPDDEPALASIVAMSKSSISDLDKWRVATEKRIRRIAPLDSEFADVQTELERLRKLFEFVEKVLPPDASKAMSFFNKTFSDESTKNRKAGALSKTDVPLNDALAETLGTDVAFEHHRSKLEEGVKQHEETMRDELANLTAVIKSVQRDMQQSAGKTVDLVNRIARVETFRAAPPVDGPDGASPFVADALVPGDGHAASSPSSPHEPGAADDANSTYISKGAMKQALDQQKDAVRNWLDEVERRCNSSISSALQQKVDNNHMNAVLTQLQQAMQQAIGANELNSDNFALLAKRALLGRCASCDAINVDAAAYKKAPPVSKPSPWSVQQNAGAQIAIRPPAAQQPLQGNATPPTVSAGKLPKIPDARTAKDFPRGKIFKNPSQPDMRQNRALEPND